MGFAFSLTGFLLKLSDWLAWFVITVGRVFAWLAVILILVILFDVITREMKSSDWITAYPDLQAFFRALEPYASSTKLQELEWHLHGALFLMCLGYAYVKDAHVRIELLRDNFGSKLRAWVELVLILAFMTPYLYLVITTGIDFAERSYIRNEGSSAMTGLPERWIIKSFLPLGFTVLAIGGLSIALRCVIHIFGPHHLSDEAGDYFRPKSILEREADTDADEALMGLGKR